MSTIVYALVPTLPPAQVRPAGGGAGSDCVGDIGAVG